MIFPRRIEQLTMNTFRPPEVTPESNQTGVSVGIQDRFAISSTLVLESTLAVRWFEVDVNTEGREPMIYTPETQQGSFFNDQARGVGSLQWVEALTISRHVAGSHLFKFGLDFQDSHYNGTSISRPLEIGLDGSLPSGLSRVAPHRKFRLPSWLCSLRIAGASVNGSPWSSGFAWIVRM